MDFIFNTLSIVIFTFFLLSLLWIFKKRAGIVSRSPPKADGARPFTGHLHVMTGESGEVPHVKLGSLADDHGPIFTINLGLRSAVVVSSFELVKELFTVHDVNISNRIGLRSIEILTHNFAMLGFTQYGSYWRQLRKLVTVELLSSRPLELTRNIREMETKASIQELYKLSSDGSELDLKKWFEEVIFNVTLMIIARKKNFDGSEKTRLVQSVKDFLRYSGMFVAADAWPILRFLDLGGHEKRMRETAKQMEEIVRRWLEEADRRRNEKSGEDKAESFMDVLLSVIPTAQIDSDRDTNAIIRATCENMILGAIDTTSITLTWALSILLNHPNSLQAAQQELDIKIGRTRFVTESDLNDLDYLNAIVKESLRLYPTLPLSAPREFSEDCVIGGYNIRKGTWLIVNLWKLHRDRRLWANELEFKPERFLNENKNVDIKGQHYEFTPFGSGRRMCVGMNLGFQMVRLLLASLLHAFEIKTINDELVDMTESIGLTSGKVTPLNVILKPRLENNLYL